jgi:hypothetical protein
LQATILPDGHDRKVLPPWRGIGHSFPISLLGGKVAPFGGERKDGNMRLALLLLLSLATPVSAQNFTTAAEVKPILLATKANWVALREYDGNDLLYFTHLESWRCGLSEVRFSVNSTAATKIWEMEPCHEGEAQPNALKLENHLPYTTLPLGMVSSVSVVAVFDDGTEERMDYDRKAILMP